MCLLILWELRHSFKRLHQIINTIIMAKTGKNYVAAAAKVEKEKLYTRAEAAKLITETSTTKFDSSVELHVNLDVDVRHADQIVRGTLVLPNGTGKTVKIAAIVESDMESVAKKAGADLVNMEDLIADIKKGNINFDIAIAQPQVMKKMGPIAKALGTKGMMPSPKSGTVTADIEKAIGEIKKGKIEYKTDKTGIIHSMVGKVSFGAKKLEENIAIILEAILAAKPAAVKGIYVKSIALASSMGPGIRVDVADVQSR